MLGLDRTNKTSLNIIPFFEIGSMTPNYYLEARGEAGFLGGSELLDIDMHGGEGRGLRVKGELPDAEGDGGEEGED